MKISTVLACVATAALSAPSLVDAHGYMMLPKAQLASGDPTRYATEIRGTTVMPVPAGGSFSSSPQVNVDSFSKAFKASSFTSLRDLIEKKSPSTPACGITPPGGAPQPVPDHVEWSAFADSHVGPCEVWCDQKRVFQEDNCAGKYPARPAKLPINAADCANAKELKFYWLALHSQDWQIYINCAPLKGGGGGGGGGNGGNGGGNGGGNNRPVSPAATPALRSNPPANRPPANRPPTAPTPPRPNPGNNDNNNGGGETGGEADCDDDLPVAGDDCDNDLPVAGDNDCDDDLPVAGDDDCDDDLPVAGDGKGKGEYGGDNDNIGFGALQRGAKYSPGKARTN